SRSNARARWRFCPTSLIPTSPRRDRARGTPVRSLHKELAMPRADRVHLTVRVRVRDVSQEGRGRPPEIEPRRSLAAGLFSEGTPWHGSPSGCREELGLDARDLFRGTKDLALQGVAGCPSLQARFVASRRASTSSERAELEQ